MAEVTPVYRLNNEDYTRLGQLLDTYFLEATPQDAATAAWVSFNNIYSPIATALTAAGVPPPDPRTAATTADFLEQLDSLIDRDLIIISDTEPSSPIVPPTGLPPGLPPVTTPVLPTVPPPEVPPTAGAIIPSRFSERLEAIRSRREPPKKQLYYYQSGTIDENDPIKSSKAIPRSHFLSANLGIPYKGDGGLILQLRRLILQFNAATYTEDLFLGLAQISNDYSDNEWETFFENLWNFLREQNIASISVVIMMVLSQFDAIIRNLKPDGGGVARASETVYLKPSKVLNDPSWIPKIIFPNYGTIPSKRKKFGLTKVQLKNQIYTFSIGFILPAKKDLKEILRFIIIYSNDINEVDKYFLGLGKKNGIEVKIEDHLLGVERHPKIYRDDIRKHKEIFARIVKNVYYYVDMIGKKKKPFLPPESYLLGIGPGERALNVADPIFLNWVFAENVIVPPAIGGFGIDVIATMRNANPSSDLKTNVLTYLNSIKAFNVEGAASAFEYGFFYLPVFQTLISLQKNAGVMKTVDALTVDISLVTEKNPNKKPRKQTTVPKHFTASPTMVEQIFNGVPQYIKELYVDDKGVSRIEHVPNNENLTTLQAIQKLQVDKGETLNLREDPLRKTVNVVNPLRPDFIRQTDIQQIASAISVPRYVPIPTVENPNRKSLTLGQLELIESDTNRPGARNKDDTVPTGGVTFEQVKDFIKSELTVLRSYLPGKVETR